eukprot:sb/3463491/
MKISLTRKWSISTLSFMINLMEPGHDPKSQVMQRQWDTLYKITTMDDSSVLFDNTTRQVLGKNYTVTPTWLSIVYTIMFLIGNTTGLLGNILVIVATFNRHGTFRLDQATIILLRHLAISDVIFLFTYPFNINITYLVGEWVFGETFCIMTGYLVTVPTVANINIILAISIHRYVRCRYPMSMPRLTPLRSNILCAAIWTVSCGFFAYILASGYSVSFSPNLAACSFDYPQTTGNLIMIICVTDVPFLAIVTLNILLLMHVQKITRKTTKRKKARNNSKQHVGGRGGVTGGSKWETATKAAVAQNTKRGSEDIGPEEDRENSKKRRSLVQGSIAKVTITISAVRRMTKTFSASTLNPGLITTVSVVTLFATAWAPTVVRFNYSAVKGDQAVPVWLEQLRYFYFLASWGNPVMYVAMNAGFKAFFKKFCYRICRIYCLKPSRKISSRVFKFDSAVEEVVKRKKDHEMSSPKEQDEKREDALELNVDNKPVESCDEISTPFESDFFTNVSLRVPFNTKKFCNMRREVEHGHFRNRGREKNKGTKVISVLALVGVGAGIKSLSHLVN